MRFQTRHTANFARASLSDLLKSLLEIVPPHGERIPSFHYYATPIFDDPDSAHDAGRILRQARPKLCIIDATVAETVSVSRDRPPEVRRRNLGLHMWKAIGDEKFPGAVVRVIHRARGAHPHSLYRFVDEDSDTAKLAVTIGWTDHSDGCRVDRIEVASEAPDRMRSAIANVPPLAPEEATVPTDPPVPDAEMPVADPSE